MQYEIIRSKRKSIGIVITRDGKIQVRAPFRVSEREIQRIVEEKKPWILKHLQKIESRQQEDEAFVPMKFTKEQEQAYRKQMKIKAEEICEQYSVVMGVTYNKVTIKDQKTRWGSCSSKGNINLCWRLILMPPEILEYVIVHELAHRKQMNHSRLFWDEVENGMPNYRGYRRWLKENGYKYQKQE